MATIKNHLFVSSLIWSPIPLLSSTSHKLAPFFKVYEATLVTSLLDLLYFM